MIHIIWYHIISYHAICCSIPVYFVYKVNFMGKTATLRMNTIWGNIYNVGIICNVMHVKCIKAVRIKHITVMGIVNYFV